MYPWWAWFVSGVVVGWLLAATWVRIQVKRRERRAEGWRQLKHRGRGG